MAAAQLLMGEGYLPAPPSGDRTIAQLDFDAWPLVDNASGHVISIHAGMTSANVVSSPVVSGSSGALVLPNGWYAETDTLSTDPALAADGMTLEAFIRRAPGGSGNWNFLISGSVKIPGSTYIGYDLAVGHDGTHGDYAEAFRYSVDTDFGGDGTDTYVSYTLPDDTWVHIALALTSTKFRAFIAGTRILDEDVTMTGDLSTCSFSLMLAKFNHVGGGDTAYFDGLRCRAGALYDVDFTPPTAQFTFP
jgi:hypothetical protein